MGLLSLFWPASQLRGATKKTSDRKEEDPTDSSFSQHLEGFEDLCQRLESNDPKVTSVTLGNLNNIKAVTLGQCLSGNTNVSKLSIDFAHLHRFTGSIFCFLDFIEFSPALATVELYNADLSDTRVCSTLLVLLPAISKNVKVRDFIMQSKDLVFYDVFGAFWHTITIALFGGHPSATLLQTAVTVSMCQCQSLSHLQLTRLPEGFLCQLLPDLHKVTDLTSVTLAPKYYSIATFLALSELVQKSPNLEKIGLSGYRLTAKRLAPLLTVMLETKKCKALELTDCRLNRGASQGLLSLFSGKGMVEKLKLHGTVSFQSDPAVYLVNILTGEDSTLKVLDLTHFHLRKHQTMKILGALSIEDDDDDEESVAPVNTTLERLSLHSLSTEEEIDALKSAASSLIKLKSVHIETLTAPSPDHIDDLLGALQCNVNIEQCSWNGKIHQLQKQATAARSRPIDRTAALKRKESLRSLLSDDEIDAINAKDEFLQLRDGSSVSVSNTQQAPSNVEEEDGSNWEDLEATTNNAEETKGSVESAAIRHSLGSHVQDLLKHNPDTEL